jgi:DNA-binding XRE family transcriptional regulator
VKDTPAEPRPPRGINVPRMTITTPTALLPTDIGGRLKHYRKRCGYSREQVAELIGRRRGAIQDYERGQRTPSLAMLRELADLYEVSFAQLFGPDWR